MIARVLASVSIEWHCLIPQASSCGTSGWCHIVMNSSFCLSSCHNATKALPLLIRLRLSACCRCAWCDTVLTRGCSKWLLDLLVKSCDISPVNGRASEPWLNLRRFLLNSGVGRSVIVCAHKRCSIRVDDNRVLIKANRLAWLGHHKHVPIKLPLVVDSYTSIRCVIRRYEPCSPLHANASSVPNRLIKVDRSLIHIVHHIILTVGASSLTVP
jgi:hypothetical protein